MKLKTERAQGKGKGKGKGERIGTENERQWNLRRWTDKYKDEENSGWRKGERKRRRSCEKESDKKRRQKRNRSCKFQSSVLEILRSTSHLSIFTIYFSHKLARLHFPFSMIDTTRSLKFLNSLNRILIWVSIFSLAFSVLVGFIMAKRISHPILRTARVAKQISDGDYNVRIEETANTKEVNELTKSINHLADSLGKQENLRKQLTADVAHELRTPLTTLQTHIEAMVEGVWQPTTERLQSCYDETIRLGKLVKDLESLARVDSNNLRLEKTQVNLLEVVKKVLLNFEAELKNKDMHVLTSGSCSDIFADHDRISQVVINLLSNAVKYTLQGGNINIDLSETDRSITLSIQDNGIGIPSEELPFIFERFYRADKSRNRKTGGTGIGLAIVKSIITAHGGTVEVQSVLNEGSHFKVTLPKP